MSTKRFPKKLKWILTRLGLSVLFSPFIIYTYGVLSPSTAYATTPGEEVTDSQTSPESSQDASQEVVQEDISPELAQSSIDEMSTAVATAESEINNVEQELQDTKDLEATIEATPETSEAISNAESGVASASSEVESASSLVEQAQTDLDEWNTAIDESDAADAAEAVAQSEADTAEADLQIASDNVTVQEAVVADKQQVKEDAQDAYDSAASSSSETVVEDFKNESGQLTVSTTDIDIKIGDRDVTTEWINGVALTTSYMDGTSLDSMNATADLNIYMPEGKNVTEIGFDVYAKNGDLTAYANLYDSSGATSTESFVVQDNVNSSYPNYTHTEVYQSPSGYYISSFVLPEDPWDDFYIIDKIYYVAAGTPLDPTYQENLTDATNNYNNAVSELTTLEAVEADAQTTYDTKADNLITAIANAIFAQEAEEEAATTAQSSLSIAQTAVASIQDAVDYAASLVSTANDVVSAEVTEQTQPEPVSTNPKPKETTYVVQPVAEEKLSPSPVVVALEPKPEKETQELPEPQQDTKEEVPEEPKVQSPQLPSLDSTTEEKVEFLVESLEEGESLDLDEILELGVELEDLPEETPISVRTDSSGNAVVITAKDAVAIEMVSDPQKLAAALVTDPGAVVEALSSVGKDMTEEEREESQEVVIASVVVANVANLASNAAAAGGAVAYRRKP